VAWTFSRRLHRRETVAGLARRHLDAVAALVALARTPARTGGALAPSDFPRAGVSRGDLGRLLGKLTRRTP
jgi:hypothetical protein